MKNQFVMLRRGLPCTSLRPTLAGGVGDLGAAHHCRAEAWLGSSDTHPLLGLVGVVGCLGSCGDSSGAETALVVACSAVGPSSQLGHREAQGDGDGVDDICPRGWHGCAAVVQKRRLDSCLKVFVSCRVS